MGNAAIKTRHESRRNKPELKVSRIKSTGMHFKNEKQQRLYMRMLDRCVKAPEQKHKYKIIWVDPKINNDEN